MIPYVQREVLRAWEQIIFRRVVKCVGFVSDEWGNELRCHELCRAIYMFLRDFGQHHNIEVVDGKLGAMEHSWLGLAVPIAKVEIKEYRVRGYGEHGMYRQMIIDPYAPGRLPHVQLIDPVALLRHGYEPGERRTDIDPGIELKLYREMKSGWLDGYPASAR